MITGILIDVKNCEVKEVKFKNTLKEFYRLLKCDIITAPSFDDKHDIIADDEGLLKPNNFFQYEEIELAGNCMIVGVSENGNWKSLSGKNVNTNYKDTLNFVCSTVLAYFPKRIIKKISDLFPYISYSSFNNLSKALNYNNTKEFLSDFGFVFVEYLEIEINKPLFIEANEFSIQAVKMIVLTGGQVIKISKK